MPEATPPPTPTAAGRPPTSLAAVVVEACRRLALATGSGLLAGFASWAFLTVLDDATHLRLHHDWLVLLLPVAGLALGASYHLFGGRAGEGSALLLEEIHEPTAWVPRRMAPLVAAGTAVSHLFGASVGREGTALQMSGSLTDLLARTVRLPHRDRRWLLVAALAGGFGSMFGVPWAGALFALEVQTVRRGSGAHLRRLLPRRRPTSTDDQAGSTAPRRVEVAGAPVERWSDEVRALGELAGPALVAAFVGDRVVRTLRHHRAPLPHLHPTIDPALVARVALVGVAVGLGALVFVELTDAIRHVARRIAWPPLRPVIGGAAVVALAAVVGRDELGLSLPLIDQALAGHHTSFAEPVLKVLLTAICLGTGFVGGEVTPLFVVGTTLGSALAPTLGLDPLVGASVGFVGAFAGASNTPIACTVMGMELFGPAMGVPLAVACFASYACSGGRGIYGTQRMASAGGPIRVDDRPALVHRLPRRPPRPRRP
ncbi:MAG: Voltage-gated chloride channel protein [Acidimicrobiales bacterium]|nr:Voltage-gated chloride channel protein [Acidimicrobiales bacterium]